MRLTCSFATSLETPQHVRLAEELGYERALGYDSPALYPDVWVQLCRAADLTEHIELGPGVLIPSLRHPMVTASAIATLVAAAGPERVVAGVGSGFTGRLALGKRSLPWTYVRHYVLTVQALLRGEQVEWDEGVIQMIQPDGRFAPDRPIDVRWAIAAEGPKGIQVARDLNTELIRFSVPVPEFTPQTMTVVGTVLNDGENPNSERVLDAAGHGAGFVLHLGVEYKRVDELLPVGGREWASAYDAVPKEVRHLALHDHHLVGVNNIDRKFVSGDLLSAAGLAAGPQQWRDRFDQFEAGGCTSVSYQPAGHDIPRELEAFAKAFFG